MTSRFPTLDFAVKVDKVNNRFTHRYFEKPMNTKWVLPSNSAMQDHTRRQILSNELSRRLYRLDPLELEDTLVRTVDEFNEEPVFSGHKILERTRIIDGGLTAYKMKLRQNPDPVQLYRSTEETASRRNREKLLSRTS